MKAARGRHGFTLVEMAIVMAIMAISATLVVPALVDLGRTPQRRTAESLLSLLNAARRVAIDHKVTVTIALDPQSGDYRIDSTGYFGAGMVIQ